MHGLFLYLITPFPHIITVGDPLYTTTIHQTYSLILVEKTPSQTKELIHILGKVGPLSNHHLKLKERIDRQG